MIERLNPEGAPRPASNYAQAVRHDANSKRLIISGQIGVGMDGKMAKGMEDQLRLCWQNLFAVLEGAGFTKAHLVKTVIYVTEPGQIALSRRLRDEAMAGLATASTYIQVAGLATPEVLAEIEGEAVMG
jgi:enamine deaminase RidA (YjgF/YER057c/UK114 family)